jgi:hypothetical protein
MLSAFEDASAINGPELSPRQDQPFKQIHREHMIQTLQALQFLKTLKEFDSQLIDD